MSFLSVLLGWWLGGLLEPERKSVCRRLWLGYVDRLRERWVAEAGDTRLGLLALLLVPLLGLALVQILVHGWLFGLPSLLLGVAVLALCLEPAALEDDIEQYRWALSAGHMERALHFAARLVAGPVPVDPRMQARTVLDAAFLRANEYVFGVVFWFLLLGPVGAFGYRALALLRERADALPVAWRALLDPALEVLEWVPARLLALTFAVVGNFDGVMRRVARRDGRYPIFDQPSDSLLTEAGAGALGCVEDEPLAMLSLAGVAHLLRRSFQLWLGVLALGGLLALGL